MRHALFRECPTPKKARFATQEMADVAVKRSSFEMNKQLFSYGTCPCGWIHLSSKKTVKAPSLTALGALDDEAFALAASNDVKGVAHPDDMAALRHPENLMRWKRALTVFATDLEIQLAQNAGKRSDELSEWRRRMQVVRISTSGRRDECMALIEEYRTERKAKDRAQAEERAIAGERAVKRLIEAHLLDFQRFLAEECAAQGVEIPRRIQRHIELTELGIGDTEGEE